jgi:hypothetical protein
VSAPVRVALVVLALLLAGCGATPTASPGGAPSTEAPVATPSPSPEPTVAAATATPSSEPPIGMLRDTIIEVVVTDLVVRSHPTVDAPSTILDGRLTAPDRAFIVDGPVLADGYEWYQVAPLDRTDGTRGPFGWIARAARDGEAWVVPAVVECAAMDDLAGIIALKPLERLACFPGPGLELTAPAVTCGAGGGPWTFDPPWISMVGGCGLAMDSSGERVLLFRVPPGEEGPTAGPATVTGHFNDSAAAGCTVTTADPVAYPAPAPEEAILLCRTEFVLGPIGGP